MRAASVLELAKLLEVGGGFAVVAHLAGGEEKEALRVAGETADVGEGAVDFVVILVTLRGAVFFVTGFVGEERILDGRGASNAPVSIGDRMGERFYHGADGFEAGFFGGRFLRVAATGFGLGC